MKSFAIGRPWTAFSHGKAARQRSPRQRARTHLKWISTLPCVICHREGRTQAAHVRLSSPAHGKRSVGIAEKPDDCWVVPLCAEHHLLGSEAQHAMAEAAFWAQHDVDPLLIALALWRASGDDETGSDIVMRSGPKRCAETMG